MQLFFVLSWMQESPRGGTYTRSIDGLFTPGPGATRQSVLHQLKKEHSIRGPIVFFSLIRNEL